MNRSQAKRIAILVRAMEGGGAQRDAILLANGLVARGHTVSIPTLVPEGPLRPLVSPAVEVVPVGARSLKAAAPALRSTIARLAPDAVMSSEAAQNVVAFLALRSLPAARRPKILLREVTSPSLARSTDPYLQNRLAYRLLGPIYARADRTITLTHGAKADLVAHFGVPAAKIAVMASNAVLEPQTVARLEAAPTDRRERGLIAAVGRLSPEKDHATLVNAFAKLPAETGARLVIIGEGSERARLEALIAGHGLGDRVRLVGHDPDPFAWLMRAEIAVNSSRFEGFGNAIIEAMAAGCRVIATDCPFGPTEILEGGRLGQLVPVGDAVAMASAMNAALASSRDAALEISAFEVPAQGRQAARRYTIDGAARAFEDILAELEPADLGTHRAQRADPAKPPAVVGMAAMPHAPHKAGVNWRTVQRGLGRYAPGQPFQMRNREPLVTFTFDDVPQSAFDNGARVLEAHGFRGTFYIAPGIAGTIDDGRPVIDEEGIRALHDNQHELGGHTYSHVRVDRLTADQMREEDDHCVAALHRICGPFDIESFAFPFGVVTWDHKRFLMQRYGTCRGIYEGLNRGLVDLSCLRVRELYDRTIDEAGVEAALDEAVRRNGWLIFYTHDVAAEPSWIGCTPRLIDFAANAVRRRGIRCVTMAEALPHIGLTDATLGRSA